MVSDLAQPTIEDLLPHRGRMLLIDEIVTLELEAAVSRSRVTERWPLFDGTGVPALMVIELVAQTSGLGNGYNRMLVQGEDSEKKGFWWELRPPGFILTICPWARIS